MREQLGPTSNFLMKVTILRKDKENEKGYKVVDSKLFKSSRREFLDSLQEDRENGINHEIEIVYKEPDKFKINQIYMLADRKKIWVYVEEDGDENKNN